MRTTKTSLVLPTLATAIVVMIIAGMIDMHFGEIILAGALGALAMQVWRLRQALEELEDHVINSETANKPVTSHQPITPRAVATSESTTLPLSTPIARQEPAVTPLVEKPAADTPTIIRATIPSPSIASSTARPARRVYVAPHPSAFELQVQAFWNWLKTRNPIALAAVTISFLGGVFLVKYAAEHSHFPIEYRFIGLSVVALAAIIGGWRIHSRNTAHKVFAQILQGGGIAGLYLTVFAATRLYHLLPAGLAFALMAGVAVAAGLLAATQNALPLAVIGTVGGFLTPLLLSTGGGSHIALFTYYAVLNLGVFVVAWFRTWRVLNVLSFAFTFSITALWRSHAYQQPDWWSTDLFLLLFFVTFVAISILNALRQPPNLKGYVSGSLVFGLPVAAFSLHASLVQSFPYALAYSAFGMALFYVALGLTLRRTANHNFKLLIEAFAALAVIFASLAIPLAFSQQATAAMWSFEGTGMIWLGLRSQRKLPRLFGMLLQVTAGYSYLHALMISTYAPLTLLPVLNSEYLGSILLCATAWFSAWLLHLHDQDHTDQPLATYEKNWAVIAFWVGCGWWLLGSMHEIHARLDNFRVGAALIQTTIGACILWFTSQRWAWRLPSIVALLATAAGAFIALMMIGEMENSWHPFAYWGMLGWPVTFAVQYTLLWLCDQQPTGLTNTHRSLINGLHTLTYLALAGICSWEAHWQCSQFLTGIWPTLLTGLIPALMFWLLTRPKENTRWPVNLHGRPYRIHAGMALAAFIQLWLLVVNLSNVGDPVYITYIPLLNPLDITSLLLFGIVYIGWRSLTEEEQHRCWPFTDVKPIVITALLIFLWLNAALIRTLHYYFDVQLDIESLFESTLVQTTLSIFWMLLSLIAMLYASRCMQRTIWLTGAILMAVVIAKLLLIDLAHTGTLARIISFLTVGGLLFVVSYFSPLPPASTMEKSAE